MDVTFGMLTAPRSKNTISNSLLSLFDEWGSQVVHVFAEPGVEEFAGSSRIIRHNNPNRFGVFWNWVHMARFFVDSVRSEWFCLCDDDITWVSGAKEVIQKKAYDIEQAHEKVGLLSAYTARPNGHPEEGWAPMRLSDTVGLCGTLALIFPRESLIRVLDSLHMKNPKNDNQLDYRIGKALQSYKYPILNHTPTLVYHTGEDCSTMLRPNSRMVLSYSRQPYIGERRE